MTKAKRDRLVVEHLPKVRALAGRLRGGLPPGTSDDDLYQAGAVGLIRAARLFDGRKGIVFWGYAKERVRGAILDHLRELDHLSRDTRRAVNNEDSIAEGYLPPLSLSAPVRDTSKLWLMGTIPDNRMRPDVEAGASERHQIICQALSELRPRYAMVMAKRYWGDQTFLKVANALGVNESRASQINTAALSQLRQYFGSIGITASSF